MQKTQRQIIANLSKKLNLALFLCCSSQDEQDEDEQVQQQDQEKEEEEEEKQNVVCWSFGLVENFPRPFI